MKTAKRLLSILLVLSMSVGFIPGAIAAGNTMPFTDVKSHDWCYSAVQYVYDEGLMSGTSANTFAPNDTTTRGMIVTILHRMEKTPTEDGEAFSDVKSGQYYTSAVAWASKNNIVTGYGNGKFGPNDAITREQMAAILYRYAQYKKDKTKETADLSSYSDSSKVSTYAVDAMKWAVGKGLISGTGDNKLSPTGSATRAQVAMILARFCGAKLENVQDQNVSIATEKISVSKDLYVSAPNSANVAEDSETGLVFVNNELIIHAEIGTTQKEIQELLENHNGTIVGVIAATATYQVRFTNSYTYRELCVLKSTIDNSHFVSWSSLNLAIEETYDHYPISDERWKNEWSTVSSGENWGIEAIHAPEAWDYRDAMSYVNVGVYDCCFHSHTDLVYQQRYFNDTTACGMSHGTHVAGTIAAGFDNGKGISGVTPYVNLYGFSWSKSNYEKQGWLTNYELALTALIHKDKCKVLNFSCNTGRVAAFAASRGNQKAQKYIKENATEIGLYLKRLLDLGNEFVICVAAGNTNGYQYVSKLFSKYGYEEYSGSGTPLSGGVQAIYNNFLCSITVPEVKNRIITVGSCAPFGNTYAYSEFSNIGLVDVVAPGEEIWSTVSNNGYDSNDGTSMATPHVSGVAAMLFSIDGSLKGSKVKSIIKETATKNVINCNYGMVNAHDAVLEVFSTNTKGYYSIKGKIISSELFLGAKLGLEGVSISVIDKKTGKEVYSTKTNSSGAFLLPCIDVNKDIGMFWTKYSVYAEKSGYTKLELKETSNYMIAIGKVYDLGTHEMSKTSNQPSSTDKLTISGTVIDEKTRMPLFGVEVGVYDEAGILKLYSGRTDVNGKFAVAVRPNAYSLTFEKKDTHETNFNLSYLYVSQKDEDLGIIEMKPLQSSSSGQLPGSGQNITGIVLDLTTRKPVAGIKVEYNSEMHWNEIEDVITDSSGRFTFTGKTVSDDWWSLYVSDTGTYTFSSADNPTATGYGTFNNFCGYLYVRPKTSALASNWVVDSDRTTNANGIGPTAIFGSAFRDYGSSLTMNGGMFSYYIGAGIGGRGTYSVINPDNIISIEDKIYYEITTYESQERETGYLSIRKNSDGTTSLIMSYYGYDIYWKAASN